MKSGDKPNNLNKIAFVGASPYALSSMSFFVLRSLTKYIEEVLGQSTRIELPEVFYFSNYNYEEDLSAEAGLRFYHVHSLPSMIKTENFDIIVYFIENNGESYLYNWICDSYPGVVVLQDASLFKAELSSLFHATDPIGIDRKLKSSYPDSAASLGKQHVLGRSIDIYSGAFNFLDSLKSSLPVIVLDKSLGNILQLSLPSSECIPVSDYLGGQSENKEKIKKEVLTCLIILNSPFSFLSKEMRILVGYESYRDLNYPVYLMLESKSGKLESIKELTPQDRGQSLLKELDSIILTDLNFYQGIPSIIYSALLEGIRISLPEVTKEEMGTIEGVCFHNRLSPLKDIMQSLENIEASPSVSLSPEFMEKFIRKLSELSHDFRLQLKEKSNTRKDRLFSRLKHLSDLKEHSGVKLQTPSSSFKQDLKEMFNYDRD